MSHGMIAAHVIHVTLFLCATKMYSAIAAVYHHTRVMAVHEIWRHYREKTGFNTYLSFGRSNQKVEESGLAFF